MTPGWVEQVYDRVLSRHLDHAPLSDESLDFTSLVASNKIQEAEVQMAQSEPEPAERVQAGAVSMHAWRTKAVRTAECKSARRSQKSARRARKAWQPGFLFELAST